MDEYSDIMRNGDAERSVIGSMMLDTAAVQRLDMLADGDFDIPANRIIMRTIRAIAARGEPVDLVTITTELQSRGVYEDAGGVFYLTELSRYVPTTLNIDTYVKLVKEAAARRSIRDKGEEFSLMAREGVPVDDILRRCEEWVKGLRSGVAVDADESIGAVLMQVMGDLENRSKGVGLGAPMGIAPLDAMMGGLFDSEVTVLAGRPGVGKTAFALYVMKTLAESGRTVQIFTREMSDKALTERVLSNASGVSQRAMRTGSLSEEDWSGIAEGASKLYDLPIFIDTRSNSPAFIRAKCRRRKERDGLGLIVIDYLQLLASDRRQDNANARITEISGAIRNLSGEFNVPILLLSQLNRGVELRKGKESKNVPPVAADLRDSGTIEQDANNVIILWEPTVIDHTQQRYLFSTKRRYVRAEILKHRNGETGQADFLFEPERMRFHEPPPGFRQGQSYDGEDAS